MSNTDRARLMVSVFDGQRREISSDIDLLITLTNGFHEQVERRNHKGPSILFDMPFCDNFGDNYSVVVYADGYEEAGFYPVKVDSKTLRHVDIMLLKESATFNFSEVRWEDFREKYEDLAKLLAAGSSSNEAAKKRYTDLMENQSASLACLLNLTTAMSQIFLRRGTPLTYIKELIWDKTMAQDRFFCFADIALIDMVLQAQERGIFVKAPGTLHPGATRSFKQLQSGEANVQLTFHENDPDTKEIGGVKCCKLELDIDYFQDAGAHLILEVLKNKITGSLSDPSAVYVLRWMAGRQAGQPEFNPPFVIT